MSTEIEPRRSNRSESIAKLAEALSKAQGQMEGAVKMSDNPYFKSKYADLASVWEACRKPLSDNQLAVVQTTDDSVDNGRVIVETILMHASGEWISGRIALKPVKDDPQGAGSAITYARRYGLQGIVGIAPEDDDGNAASGNGKATASSNVKRTEAPLTFTRKSAPLNNEQGGGNQQKGNHPPDGADNPSTAGVTPQPAARVAELESGKPLARPAVETISPGQQSNFHKECRAAVKPTRSMEADNLTYQWLTDNHYVNEKGQPTAAMIPAAGWLKERDKAISWLRVQ